MRVRSFLVPVGVLALACTGGKSASCGEGTVEVDGECVPAETTSESDADTDADTDADSSVAPTILSFSTNLSAAQEDDEIVFSAVVTDPQGVDDVIGGVLESSSGATYGAFATASSEGAYELSVSWNDMNSVDSISFTSSETRVFTARFYDQAGHEVTGEASVALSCSRSGYGACEGDCVDLTSDPDNCGGCGNTCVLLSVTWAEEPVCQESACVVLSDCVPESDIPRATCEDVCVASGHSSCATGSPPTYSIGYALNAGTECDTSNGWEVTASVGSCDDVLFRASGPEGAVCVCRE